MTRGLREVFSAACVCPSFSQHNEVLDSEPNQGRVGCLGGLKPRSEIPSRHRVRAVWSERTNLCLPVGSIQAHTRAADTLDTICDYLQLLVLWGGTV